MTQRGRSEDFKIEKKFFSSLPKTMIDPSSMEQAFLNIILNAQKAMPRGGTFTVSTLALPQRKDDGKEIEEVQIVFEDTGVGIPEKTCLRFSIPFSQPVRMERVWDYPSLKILWSNMGER